MQPALTGGSSCAGYRHRGQRFGRSAQGFTLIELLIAMLIAAVIVSMVAVTGTPNPARALETDADRLAQLLALAREEAQIRSAPIRFQSDGTNYRFVVFKDSEWRVIEDDTYLRPRQWDVPTDIEVRRADGARFLEFGRDLVEAPYLVRLVRDNLVVEIAANGLGTFEVVRR
ncbi:MAG: GspH/FimT family pseudopilin [Lautropia sp.]